LFSGWKTAHLVEGGVIGVEPVASSTHFDARSRADAGALAAMDLQIVMRSWYPDDRKTLRFSFRGAIGADTSGFLAHLAHESMAGLTFPLSEPRDEERVTRSPLYKELDGELRSSLRSVFAHTPHRMFARIGYGFRLGGDQSWYASRLELPRAEVGYAYDGGFGGNGAEVRLEGAFVPAGAFHAFEGERDLSLSGQFGVRLLLHVRKASHVEASLIHGVAPLATVSGTVETLSVFACTRITEVRMLQTVCLRTSMETGDVVAPRGTVSRATAGSMGLVISAPWIEP
jgi:hypothetical protein